MRRLAAILAVVSAVCLASQSAMAGKRVALVIGNSNYQNVAALTNPANDAAAIADMFGKAGFDVVDSRRDLKAQEMRRALRDFGDKAHGADIAVIYFAGHGLEVDGINYVVPVDAVLERDADVDDEAVSLNRILLAAEPATKLRLVILDACRDNPFAKKMKRTIATRSLGRGLIGVEASTPNTFIAFAAKEGSTASDGDGQDSPFSLALAEASHHARTGYPQSLRLCPRRRDERDRQPAGALHDEFAWWQRRDAGAGAGGAASRTSQCERRHAPRL